MARLREGIVALTSSDQWRRHLDCQSRFHRYSFGNVVLINAQRPDSTRVAGFRAWRSLDRTVRRGERAIWILAPMRFRKEITDEAASDDRVVRGFKSVPVFDVSQTEGAELPVVCHKLIDDRPCVWIDRLSGAAGLIGYSVQWTELPDGLNGDCSFDLRRIRVEARNSSAQQVKTLAHELAHALLHQGQTDRRVAELEAESTAYVVCRRLGVDTGLYSFGYVAVWAGGGEAAVTGLKASGANIQRAAATLFDLLEFDGSADDGCGSSSEPRASGGVIAWDAGRRSDRVAPHSPPAAAAGDAGLFQAANHQ
jgi:antirestriction protein ArdC